MPIISKIIYECDRCGFQTENQFERGPVVRISYITADSGDLSVMWKEDKVEELWCGACAQAFKEFTNMSKEFEKAFAEGEQTTISFIARCDFVEAWIGRCKEHANFNRDGVFACEKHRNEVCWKCGKQAKKNCGHTSQFVCGAPMCDEHKHHLDG